MENGKFSIAPTPPRDAREHEICLLAGRSLLHEHAQVSRDLHAHVTDALDGSPQLLPFFRLGRIMRDSLFDALMDPFATQFMPGRKGRSCSPTLAGLVGEIQALPGVLDAIPELGKVTAGFRENCENDPGRLLNGACHGKLIPAGEEQTLPRALAGLHEWICTRLMKLGDADLEPTVQPGPVGFPRRGCFGLHLSNDNERRVTRDQFDATVSFGGRETIWKLFVALVKRYPGPYRTSDLLNDVWDNVVEEDAVRSAVGELRGLLEPIGLAVKCQRQVGYKLEELSVESQPGEE